MNGYYVNVTLTPAALRARRQAAWLARLNAVAAERHGVALDMLITELRQAGATPMD